MRTFGERERAALEEVLQAAGRGDDDVRLGGLAGLALEADAAVDGGDLQRAGVGDVPRLLDDLGRELAGRGEHERRGTQVGGLDAVDERHAEGERLARPGGRADEDVVAGEDVGDDEALDGERLGDAALGERARNGIGHAEIGEGLLGQGKAPTRHGCAADVCREATADPKPRLTRDLSEHASRPTSSAACLE